MYASMNDRIRLHISPLNPELLRVVVPPAVLASASDISYHTLQTFPERNYGYVELPAMEGKKIKKKLNGSILKGSKMSVEEARPSRKRKAAGDDDGDRELKKEEKSQRSSKKQKLEDGVIPGHELTEGRRVKRGWTEPVKGSKGKKSQKDRSTKESKKKAKVEASTYTDQSECLFKTKLSKSSEATLGKPRDESSKKKKSKGKDKEVTVHEFENTTKHPSFLRSNQAESSAKPATEFVEGRGWIDEDGNVIEEAKPDKRAKLGSEPARSLSTEAGERQKKHTTLSDEDSKPNGKARAPDTAKEAIKAAASMENDETSSSGISSVSSDSESAEDDGDDEKEETTLAPPSRTDIPTLTVTPEPADDLAKPAQPARAPSPSVHPLEQLYKRSPPRGSPKPSLKPTSTPRSTPRNPNLKVHTSFSFFDDDGDNVEDIPKTSKELGTPNDDSLITNGNSARKSTRAHKNIIIPQTPFTQLDFHERGIRSAAPTPDTAAPNKLYFEGLWKRGDDGSESSDEELVDNGHEESSGLGVDLEAVQEEDEEEEDEELASTTIDQLANGKAKLAEEGEKPESEFSKWFWEHRGETNRAWKQRRREAKKEKKRADRKKAGGRRV